MTLAPWGLAFIQFYAVDKKLTVEDLRYERIDVIVGAGHLAATVRPRLPRRCAACRLHRAPVDRILGR
jgi:hypothetical protein